MTPNKGDRKYAMKGNKFKGIHSQATNMIDKAMSLIDICSVPEDRADLMANQAELA